MSGELTPDLAVIFIQYSRGALPLPYTDFERFEIFSTLLEELDPTEPYEVHRARIDRDPRSRVIDSELMRVELYSQWVAEAYRARRADNKEWNNFITFVNAQLKFHMYLNYEQFCYLCDEMAGFRYNSLSDNRKRSLFWGCVLRREWRFARIQQIIDRRECLEDFIGPTHLASEMNSYAKRIGSGLELPEVPSGPKNSCGQLQQAGVARDAQVQHTLQLPAAQSTAKFVPALGSPASREAPVTRSPNLSGSSSLIGATTGFFRDPDVARLINAIRELEESFGDGCLDELRLSDHIYQLGAAIYERSADMKAFGRDLGLRLDKLKGRVPENAMHLWNSLLSLALSAQGIPFTVDSDGQVLELVTVGPDTQYPDSEAKTIDAKTSPARLEDWDLDGLALLFGEHPATVNAMTCNAVWTHDGASNRDTTCSGERSSSPPPESPSVPIMCNYVVSRKRGRCETHELTVSPASAQASHRPFVPPVRPEPPAIPNSPLGSYVSAQRYLQSTGSQNQAVDAAERLATRRQYSSANDAAPQEQDVVRVSSGLSRGSEAANLELLADTSLELMHASEANTGQPPESASVAHTEEEQLVDTAQSRQVLESTDTSDFKPSATAHKVSESDAKRSSPPGSSASERSIMIPIYYGHTYPGAHGLVFVEGPFDPARHDSDGIPVTQAAAD